MMIIFFWCLFALSFQVAAQAGAFSPLTFDYTEVQGGQYRVDSGNSKAANGQRLFDKALLTPTSGGLVASGSGAIRNPSGNPIAVAAQATIPAASVAAAVGRALNKVIFPLAVADAIYGLIKELKFDLSVSPAGVQTFTKDTDTIDTTRDYSVDGNDWFGSSSAACDDNITKRNAVYAQLGNGYIATQTSSDPRCAFKVTNSGYPGVDFGGDSSGYSTRTKQIFGASVKPSTRQAFLDAVAARSGWPSTSKIADAVAKDPNPELLKTGSPAVTGPATSQGGTSTTNNTANNTTSVTTTTHNHTYAGDTITTVTNNTTVTTNNTTGAQTTITTVSTPPAITPPVQKVETCGLPGTPACKIDETGTKSEVASDEYAKQLDALRDKNAADLATVAGTQDKSFFSGWGDLFKVPALVACEGFVLPNAMGTINPCGVVDGVRSMMAYIWALLAFYWCLGMVREVL